MSEEMNVNAGNLEQASESGSVSFTDQLPEDLRSEPSLSDFKDITGLAKSYVSAQKMLGGSIRVPTEDASAEAKEEFYNKLQDVPGVVRIPEDGDMSSLYTRLGRPETADQYKVDVEGEFDSESLGAFKNMAHELGLNNTQLNKVIEFDIMRTDAYREGMETYKSQATEVLQQAWGTDFENRMSGAKEALKSYSEKYPEFVNELMNGDNPFGNNPIVIMALSELHGTMKESGVVSGSSGVKYGLSAEDAQNQLDDIRSNPSHPYFNATDPSHDAAVAKVNKLYSVIYGG
jgi:hypothetical protein